MSEISENKLAKHLSHDLAKYLANDCKIFGKWVAIYLAKDFQFCKATLQIIWKITAQVTCTILWQSSNDLAIGLENYLAIGFENDLTISLSYDGKKFCK